MLNEDVSVDVIEEDPRFEAILDDGSGSLHTSAHAVAELVGWFRCCINAGVGLEEVVDDIDDVVAVLRRFKAAVLKDPTLITEDAPEADG